MKNFLDLLKTTCMRKFPGSLWKSILSAALFFLIFTGSGTPKKLKIKKLYGTWTTDNTNGKFSRADTIIFYKNINRLQRKNICRMTQWNIKKRSFYSYELFHCQEPPLTSVKPAKEKLKLSHEDFGTVLKYYRNDSLIEQYRIIKAGKGQFILMRFDRLSEQKLYKYVDSLIVNVLKFKPPKKNTLPRETVKKDTLNKSKHTKSWHKVLEPVPVDEPFILINDYEIKNKEILKELLLAETYEIKIYKGVEARAIYGSRAKYGVIYMLTSEKRFRKVYQKYK